MGWKGTSSLEQRQQQTPFAPVVANQYLNQLGFVETINRSVEWDSKQCKVSPGLLAKSVVLSTFADTRTPLYRIWKTFYGTDIAMLFGEGLAAEDFSDDAIARTLDKISAFGTETLFSRISLAGLAAYDVPVDRLHCDTTSITLAGAYEECEEEDYQGLSVCHGYSKDHRPDLKQVVLGKVVNEHGIPLVSLPLDGNTSDTEFNRLALNILTETYGERLEKMVYIADSKLINLPTLKIFTERPTPVQFISRCPDAFYRKLAVRVKRLAFESDGNWVSQGAIGEGKQCAQYQTQGFREWVDGSVYRLIVVKTSAGRERVDKILAKDRNSLEKALALLADRPFACEADARKAAQLFDQEHKNSCYEWEWNLDSTTVEKRSRGNPGKTPKPPITETTWRVQGKIFREKTDKCDLLRYKDESFVLITNVAEEAMSDREVLRQYKEQHRVEVQFRTLKEPALAAQIFLKKPGRIDALLMLLSVALLIRGLMQFRVRQQLAGYSQTPRIGMNRAKLTQPTAEMLLILFKSYVLIREGPDYRCECQSNEDLKAFPIWMDLLGIQFE
ncbi:IS1634 family transposase [Methylomusa anaerophila]|uniref:DUF4277 domain-containing protein n=1 Tax=Methylomusa anaerophila TaxID=1930071 RepID=A0A348AID0_9FIRM|nr:IS1634 family transposase [Methylomusa anaerophila]BBB89886.1 hypothetical protein MAMMFC1_00526 [Methylomusa anaerophila]BBB90389.1 hypothetical protein MAMMFC1_01037 [Methylomusa anaerophila]BBB90828.1 hypothetical protein MAMMFC1_01490 [Methylomusa anaerophila]BBB90872.1 hypothetical protein MAMMFC1_01539 [Methylomusa anaerophila]